MGVASLVFFGEVWESRCEGRSRERETTTRGKTQRGGETKVVVEKKVEACFNATRVV
jgi:hypothetical protein